MISTDLLCPPCAAACMLPPAPRESTGDSKTPLTFYLMNLFGLNHKLLLSSQSFVPFIPDLKKNEQENNNMILWLAPACPG